MDALTLHILPSFRSNSEVGTPCLQVTISSLSPSVTAVPLASGLVLLQKVSLTWELKQICLLVVLKGLCLLVALGLKIGQQFGLFWLARKLSNLYWDCYYLRLSEINVEIASD